MNIHPVSLILKLTERQSLKFNFQFVYEKSIMNYFVSSNYTTQKCHPLKPILLYSLNLTKTFNCVSFKS